MKKLSIADVNVLPYEDFIAKFGNVIEHCALSSASVWAYRPFKNLEEMQARFEEFIDQLPLTGKAGILRLYPDLAGKLAQSGRLTSESVAEHASAGLNNMSDTERAEISELNEKYKNIFGFPFVICARQNKKEAILLGLENRLKNSSETEVITGVNEVKKICSLRLSDLVDDVSPANF